MRWRAISASSLAVENLTVGRMEPVRFIEEAAAAGFGAVGLALATATAVPLGHEIVGKPTVIAAVRSALRQTGLRVLDVEAFVLAPGSSVEAWRPVLEVGAELGATWISAIGAPVAGPSLAGAEREALFGDLCEEAEHFGLGVGLECMLYRDVRTAADALHLLEGVGSRRAGIILDVLHLHRAGSPLNILADVSPERIAWAQLCDVVPGPAPDLASLPAEARGGRLHPGHGVADLDGFMEALPEDVPIAVETPVAADAGLTTKERLQAAAAHAVHFLDAWALGAT